MSIRSFVKIRVMSGHSKWATIHRAKEVKDAKRGAIFTKLGAAITVAVKQGGGVGDPDQNFRLRIVVDKAKQANMPKENINRAIEKGLIKTGTNALQEATYEGFLPGGVAVLVETVTDNKLRTAQQIRMVLDKNGGSLAGAGAVSYLFSSLGEMVADIGGLGEEEAELLAIDTGVMDIDDMEDKKLLLFCERDRLYEIKKELEKKGMKVESAELVMRPVNVVEIQKSTDREKIEKIIGMLEEIDGVAHVWCNYA